MQAKSIYTLLGPVLGLLVWALLVPNHAAALAVTAGVAVCMAVWWITEAISIYFTALLPAVAFPLFGVIGMKELAPAYMPQIIFLFIGGFFLAFALEKWDLHKRIALRIILAIGTKPSRILLGFMVASYVLSMWILNTATVMMLLPAVLAVIKHVEEHAAEQAHSVAVPLLLGLAFASSIGGTATLIGTAPNLIFSDFYNSNFPTAEPITFASWFLFGFPMSLVFFVIAYQFLKRKYFSAASSSAINIDFVKAEYRALGPVTFEQLVLGWAFVATVLLWFFAKDIQLGNFTILGWTRILPEPEFVKESTIAMFTAFLLFLIPSKKERGKPIITWKEARKLPFGVIMLFGGGFALAKGVTDSGLSQLIGEQLSFLEGVPALVLVACLCLFMTFFTELTSNTASIVLMLPLLLAMTAQVDAHPLLLMLPVSVSASFAFMLPVATPPNTIVFGSERLTVRDMARAGVWLNLIGVVVVVLLTFTLGSWVFGL